MVLNLFNIFNIGPFSGADALQSVLGNRRAKFEAAQVSGEDVPGYLRQDVGLPPDFRLDVLEMEKSVKQKMYP